LDAKVTQLMIRLHEASIDGNFFVVWPKVNVEQPVQNVEDMGFGGKHRFKGQIWISSQQ
jgi:hypothetical protein